MITNPGILCPHLFLIQNREVSGQENGSLCVFQPVRLFVPSYCSVLILLVILGLCHVSPMTRGPSIAAHLNLNPSVPWRLFCHRASWLVANIENLGFYPQPPTPHSCTPCSPLDTMTFSSSSHPLLATPLLLVHTALAQPPLPLLRDCPIFVP